VCKVTKDGVQSDERWCAKWRKKRPVIHRVKRWAKWRNLTLVC